MFVEAYLDYESEIRFWLSQWLSLGLSASKNWFLPNFWHYQKYKKQIKISWVILYFSGAYGLTLTTVEL